MPPKRASSTKSTAAKSTPSKPARPATTAKAAASAGKGKATAAKARAKPKPKPVTKLAPEYPSSSPLLVTEVFGRHNGLGTVRPESHSPLVSYVIGGRQVR